MLPITQIIFYFFSAIMLFAAFMVIIANHPVRSILFLVLAFFAASVLWMLIHAEFLALVLLFVYVGAVMTLFLFVIMMLNIKANTIKEKFVRYLPLGLLTMFLFVAINILILVRSGLNNLMQHAIQKSAVASPLLTDNTTIIGKLLFTKYILPFELGGLILLLAIIAAITLTHHGRKIGTKNESIAEQISANKADRLRLVNMKSEKL